MTAEGVLSDRQLGDLEVQAFAGYALCAGRMCERGGDVWLPEARSCDCWVCRATVREWEEGGVAALIRSHRALAARLAAKEPSP